MTTRASAPTLVDAGRLSAWLVTCWLAARAVVDPDLWGHLRFGLDRLAAGRLSSVDPYSFTQDVPWINHEWLSEVLFALAYRAGGVLGLLLLKTAVVAASVWLLASLTRPIDERLRWWLLAVALAGLGPMATTFRPQVWTILGVALVCSVLVRGTSLAWLVVIFPVWANLHGGWIVGAGLAGLWVVGRCRDRRSIREAMRPGAALVAGVAATVINPYGWRLWAFLLSTVRMGRTISEWRPLWQQADASHAVLWTLTAAVVLATAAVRWRKLTWAAILPVVWLAVSGVFVDRLMPLFAEVSLLASLAAWDGGTPRPVAAAPDGPRAQLAIDALVVLSVWAVVVIPAARCLPIEGAWAPDLVGASLLASPEARGRLVLPFDWGEFALWNFGPRLKVSIDGRRETVYSDETVALQSAVAHGLPEGLAYLKQERPEYVWLPTTSGAPAAQWLGANGYRIDDNGTSFVASRMDLPPLSKGPPLSRCFK